MRLICPNCQQAVAVPDAAAGQPTPCPLCGQTFTPPALTGAAIDAAPAPAPPAPPPRPTPPPAVITTPAAPVAAPPVTSPCCRLTLRRNVAPWLAPGALLVAFLLTFFSWVGVYPNRTPVYTQSAWEAAAGSFDTNAIGESVMKREEALKKQSRWSGWIMFYVLLLIPAALIAWAERVIPWVGGSVPNALRSVWPYRELVLAFLCAGLSLLLVGALIFGFGLEVAAARAVDEAVPPLQPTAGGAEPTTPQIHARNVQRDIALASYALNRTYWLAMAFNAHLIALIGAGLTMWLERHPNWPDPRIECYC